jgi:Transposase DDE domain
MVLNDVFDRFVEQSPVCVMQRAVMENIFAPAKLDAVFHTAAVAQYERELLFSTLVDVISLVVCRIKPSIHAAYVHLRDRIPVSAKALYDKLNHVEPSTSRALVQHTAGEVGPLIERMNGCRAPLLPGFRVRILDGNHLSGSEHRIKVLRETAAGALPGQALALLDPQRMVIEDVIPCEDGHAQERSLLDQVLPLLQPNDLLIDDRNFCTIGFLFGIKLRSARFITRQHGRMPWQAKGKRRYVGRCSTGKVYEQAAVLTNPQTKQELQLRRITVELKKPTRDGDTEIHLMTNLPMSAAKAVKVAILYMKRWTLETAFQELTMHLRCELNTLGYPKAALFAFCVAVASYNLLATVKGAIRGVHGEQTMQEKVSNYFLTEEISSVYRGMMIALPPEKWVSYQTMSSAALAKTLLRWARSIDLGKYPKSTRGPKKPRPKLPNAKFKHVSTKKLLDEKRQSSDRKQLQATNAGP